LLSVVLGLVARRLLLARLARVAENTSSLMDDALIASLRRPLPAWFLLGGLSLAAPVIPMPGDLESGVRKLLVSLFIVSVTLWAAGLASRLLRTAGNDWGTAGTPVAGVVRQVVRIAVIAVGVLVVLGTLGISVTPILTTLGIGGLAVALALQDTLANLFAGIHLTLAGTVRVGDFVRLETGEEGFVEDIHWRATRVRTLPNNFVLIPNSRLAQSIVTNYDLPSRDLAVLVEVGVHYASDLEHVERVTCEVGRDVMKTVPGGVPEFDPFIRYHSFGDSSIGFSVILRARAFTDRFAVKHEFIKTLSRRFAAEGIVIPFPIRAINVEQERARVAGD
jgi:small-conductance mechanosensitive channel